MRDFSLELLACVDIEHALEYIGKCTHHKNIYQGNKIRKPKSNHSQSKIPLFAQKTLENI